MTGISDLADFAIIIFVFGLVVVIAALLEEGANEYLSRQQDERDRRNKKK